MARMAPSSRAARLADRHRIAAWNSEITLRPASDGDADALMRLAQLESRPLSEGPHLVAARNGVVEAALCIRTGELIADPFRRTAELCSLLRCHAGGARLAPLPTPTLDPGPCAVLAPA
jgi:hypothetical protein